MGTEVKTVMFKNWKYREYVRGESKQIIRILVCIRTRVLGREQDTMIDTCFMYAIVVLLMCECRI